MSQGFHNEVPLKRGGEGKSSDRRGGVASEASRPLAGQPSVSFPVGRNGSAGCSEKQAGG